MNGRRSGAVWVLGDDHGNWLRSQGYHLLRKDREEAIAT